MSLTPVFDATLADAPVNIWEASSIFPRPDLINPWAARLQQYPLADPANLAFLRSIA